jgi:hypothetical protein
MYMYATLCFLVKVLLVPWLWVSEFYPSAGCQLVLIAQGLSLGKVSIADC